MNKSIKFTFSVMLMGIFLLLMTIDGYSENYDPNASVIFLKQTQTTETRTVSNAGNWSYWLQYDGLSGYNPILSLSGGTYPRGTSQAIFQDGVVWGAFVRDTSSQNPRVGGQTYNIGTSAGRILTPGTAPLGAITAVAENASDVQLYRISVDYTVPFDQLTENQQVNALSVLRQDVAEVNAINVNDVTDQQVKDAVNQYAYDYANWPAEAPRNADGTPGIANADQVIWFVVNDLDIGRTSSLYGSGPMGIELQVTTWAYNQPGTALGQIIYKQYKLINKSGVTMDSMYVSQWCDPDLGDSGDDFAGCDTLLSMGFAYNGYLVDRNYALVNLPPPAAGYDFFQGPLVQGVAGQDLNKNGIDDAVDYGIKNLKKVGPGYVNLPMTAFIYFAAGSAISDPPLRDYEGTIEWYKMLNGFIPNNGDPGDNVRYTHGSGPLRGQPTPFPLDGDPFRETGDLDGRGDNLAPGDRRIAMCSGPFTLLNGDTQEVVVAVVGGIIEQTGGNNRNAVEQMKLNDGFAQIIFDSLFKEIPKPPTAPQVATTAFEDEIVLNWGYDTTAYNATEIPTSLGFQFEGYNVYQLPQVTASKAAAKLVATYDLINNVGYIRGPVFLPEFKDVVLVPIQFGTDNGIQRYFTVEKDYINDTPLYAGNEYYFVVTAYNYNPAFPTPSLESALTGNVKTIIPQSVKPGQRYTTMPQQMLDVTHTGSSTGSVEVMAIDPKQQIPAEYEVSFNTEEKYTLNPITDSTGMIVDYDTIGIWHTWNLKDLTNNKTWLTDQTNLSGDNTYQIIDGLMIKPIGSKVCGLAGYDYTGNRWISGVDWGAPYFFGGLDIGANFFGSTITAPCDLVPVQLQFQDQADVNANGYISKGPVYRRDLGYAYNGTGELPIAAYDMQFPDNPRRLNIAFVEDANAGNANQIWDMGWDGTAFADNGGREYLFIMASDYDEGVEYDATNDATVADVYYAIWPQARGDRAYLLAEFTFDIIANVPNGPGDVFTFTSEGYTAYNSGDAEADVKKINVFPNPYYAYNPSETSRFDRFVTFTHLPRKATIRIFNLGGVQVRKIDKDSDTQFEKWDLLNENDLPVASGMYIAYVDMPDLGKTKVLKVMVIQGQQIIESY
jgi:hypothetical protein